MCSLLNCALCPTVVWTAVIGVVAYFIRQYMQGGKFDKKTDETGKVVIVTGCNTGIGKETVLELARRGATVYMACRDKKRTEEARLEIVRETSNQNVYYRELDLASMDSIRKFVNGFKNEQSKLHILINNAGVMHCPRMETKDGFEIQLGVNHMGHFLLTKLLLDLLKKSAPSRIVNVSSLAHSLGKMNFEDLNSEKSYNRYNAYSQSKLANVLFTRELAKRLEGTGVTTNSLHPGAVHTDLMRHYPFINTTVGSWLIRPIQWLLFKSPKSGAQTTLYAALDPELNGVSGLYLSDCKPKEPSADAKNDKFAKLLWEESEKWTSGKK